MVLEKLRSERRIKYIDETIEELIGNKIGYNDWRNIDYYKKRLMIYELPLNIRILRIGFGENLLLGVYGMHGDELPSIESFLQTASYLVKEGYAFQNVEFIGLLINTLGIVDNTREIYINDCIEVDLNRGWGHPLSSHALALRNFILPFLKEKRRVILIDHHTDKNPFSKMAYVVVPSLRNDFPFKLMQYFSFKKPEEYIKVDGSDLMISAFSSYPNCSIIPLIFETRSFPYQEAVSHHTEADLFALNYLASHNF